MSHAIAIIMLMIFCLGFLAGAFTSYYIEKRERRYRVQKYVGFNRKRFTQATRWSNQTY